ncbi:unnamed protein product [Phytomonas sp. EM1]|nr:unnamed protein product [Phytomonas sp. EM1]|eukprot:CCW64159.1 unnamed protein product [Phytomonas sp. isolate EM1]
MSLSHADLLSILFYLNLPPHFLHDSEHECNSPYPLRVTKRSYSSGSLVASAPSFRWCADTAAFLYRCSGLLYSPSHIRSAFERIFFEDCDGKLERLQRKCQERAAAWRREEEGLRQQSEYCHVAYSSDAAKETSLAQKYSLSEMSNGDECRFSPAAVLLDTANAPLSTSDYMSDKLSNIDGSHDNQAEVTVAFEDPTSPRKRDRASEEFTVSSFLNSTTRVFSGARLDTIAKKVDEMPSMPFGVTMHTQISTIEGSRSVGCEISSVRQCNGSLGIGNVGGTMDEVRSSWPPAAAANMTHVIPPHQRVVQRDTNLRKKDVVGCDASGTDDDEDEIWSFADYTPEQRARLYRLRYNTLLGPEVLSNILQQFFLVDGAGVFFLPVPDQTIMEYNEVRSGPYCDVIYAPQSLMQVKREILESRRRYYQLKQPLGLNSIRRHGSDIRHTRVIDRAWQEFGHESKLDYPPHVKNIREPKIAQPTQHKHHQNNDVSNDGCEARYTQKSNAPSQVSTDKFKVTIHSAKDYDNNSDLSVWSHTDQILSISELERAVWQIAANCVMFNAPESYYPNTARNFAKSCSKILARWCEEHMQCF